MIRHGWNGRPGLHGQIWDLWAGGTARDDARARQACETHAGEAVM